MFKAGDRVIYKHHHIASTAQSVLQKNAEYTIKGVYKDVETVRLLNFDNAFNWQNFELIDKTDELFYTGE